MSRTFKLIILLVIAFAFSCKKETNTDPLPTYEYFPMEEGSYIIYDVDSIVHETSDNDTDDSISYYRFQIKDVVDSSFIDGTGQPRALLVRYRRANDTLPWDISVVWSQQLTTRAAYRWEDNIAYHKLSFPINTDVEWDGNDQNTFEEELYSYEDIHSPRSLNGLNYDSTITVQQIDEDNFIEHHFGKEIYANHVGLVYKQFDDLDKTFDVVTAGTEYKMTAIAFGKE